MKKNLLTFSFLLIILYLPTLSFASATPKTYGIYENLPDPIENVPEHGFITESAMGSSGKYNLKTDWILSFDFGINLYPDVKKNWHQTVYIGIYEDYGLPNLYKQGADTEQNIYPVVYNPEVKGCLQYNVPANISSSALNIHSLSVGVKIAVGLSLK